MDLDFLTINATLGVILCILEEYLYKGMLFIMRLYEDIDKQVICSHVCVLRLIIIIDWVNTRDLNRLTIRYRHTRGVYRY